MTDEERLAQFGRAFHLAERIVAKESMRKLRQVQTT